VLVAEDSTTWGRNLGLELPDLVEALALVEGVLRVRVMYAYPNRSPWRLTEVMRTHASVAPYLDIPIQHIATPVLRARNRHGSGDDVRRILGCLREEVPGIAPRATVLCGFPGETDGDATELARFVEEFERGRALVGRPAGDAPEVDLVAVVRGEPTPRGGAAVGDVLRALVEGLDAEANLLCRVLARAGRAAR
jgi:ribosomal protein S12 methylthiotransferase